MTVSMIEAFLRTLQRGICGSMNRGIRSNPYKIVVSPPKITQSGTVANTVIDRAGIVIICPIAIPVVVANSLVSRNNKSINGKNCDAAKNSRSSLVRLFKKMAIRSEKDIEITNNF